MFLYGLLRIHTFSISLREAEILDFFWWILNKITLGDKSKSVQKGLQEYCNMCLACYINTSTKQIHIHKWMEKVHMIVMNISPSP